MKSKLFAFRLSQTYIFILNILFVLILIPLLFSVFKSGYGYQFDTDELHHANLIYLIANGHVPYRDIYSSFYTPLFEWALLPVFMFFGFSFKTIIFSRFVMIVFYAIRLASLYVLIRTLWNKRAALFFIPILLFDPFAVLSSFQLRTDNFMLMLYSIGIACVAVGITKQKEKISSIGLFTLGLAALSLPKIVPSVSIITLFVYILSYKKYGWPGVIKYIFITATPVIAFLLYGFITGGFREMMLQLVVEAKAAYSVFRAPLPFGAVFYPNNMWIYGTMGKPITWMYIWILPLIGAGGVFSQVKDVLKKRSLQKTDVFSLLLALTLLINFISLIILPVVFLQHYLLINWLYALFAAVTLDEILTTISANRYVYISLITILFVAYVCMANVSITYNIARSTIHGQETIDAYEKRFSQIAPNESVFPNFLFRPPIYPIPFGYYIGNVPDIVLQRLPDIPTILEENNIQKLLFDEYTLSLMPGHIQSYITANYNRVAGDPELMIRK